MTAETRVDLERQIMAELERANAELYANELIAALQAAKPRSEGDILRAVWYLIDRGKVELTHNRKLRAIVPITKR